jgi:hypothetical protein
VSPPNQNSRYLASGSLREVAVQFPAYRLVVSLPGAQRRVFLGLFDNYPDQQVSRLDPGVVAVLQQRDPLQADGARRAAAR